MHTEYPSPELSAAVQSLSQVTWQVDLLMADQTTWYTAWTLYTADAVSEVARILCKYGRGGPVRFQVRRLD